MAKTQFRVSPNSRVPLLVALAFALLAAAGCADEAESDKGMKGSGGPVGSVDSETSSGSNLEGNGYPAYLSLADGLHVTGKPVEVEIESYRLRITGKVESPLELSYQEILELPSQRVSMELECPGFFVDQGFWTGPRLSDLLDRAGIQKDARLIRFVDIPGNYSSTLMLKELEKGEVLIAHEFDDKPFPVYHGYPLRIAAEGQFGSIWVKWLGTINVE